MAVASTVNISACKIVFQRAADFSNRICFVEEKKYCTYFNVKRISEDVAKPIKLSYDFRNLIFILEIFPSRIIEDREFLQQMQALKGR